METDTQFSVYAAYCTVQVTSLIIAVIAFVPSLTFLCSVNVALSNKLWPFWGQDFTLKRQDWLNNGHI